METLVADLLITRSGSIFLTYSVPILICRRQQMDMLTSISAWRLPQVLPFIAVMVIFIPTLMLWNLAFKIFLELEGIDKKTKAVLVLKVVGYIICSLAIPYLALGLLWFPQMIGNIFPTALWPFWLKLIPSPGICTSPPLPGGFVFMSLPVLRFLE